MLNRKDLESAVAAAARATSAVVADYVAAPTDLQRDGVELAVDFLVPPTDEAAFRDALERALASAGSRPPARPHPRGRIVVHAVPAGAIHQWRVAWRYAEEELPAFRWTGNRATLEGVLRLARVGWRESGLIA